MKLCVDYQNNRGMHVQSIVRVSKVCRQWSANQSVSGTIALHIYRHSAGAMDTTPVIVYPFPFATDPLKRFWRVLRPWRQYRFPENLQIASDDDSRQL